MFTEYALCEKPLWVSEQCFFDFFTDTLMFSFIKKIYDFQWYLFSKWSVTLRKQHCVKSVRNSEYGHILHSVALLNIPFGTYKYFFRRPPGLEKKI